MEHESRFWTMAELAEYLSVSKKTVYSYVHARELKAYKLGPKTYRVRKDELERFLRERAEDLY